MEAFIANTFRSSPECWYLGPIDELNRYDLELFVFDRTKQKNKTKQALINNYTKI